MKKRLLIMGISMLLCMMCGCLQNVPLTENEMDVVAEYAANLLLKHDTNYETVFYYEEEMQALLNPTPTPTPMPTPALIPEVNNTGASGNAELVPTGSAAATPTLTPEEIKAATSEQLTQLMEEEGFTLSFETYETMESVVSNEYFALTAKQGRRYLVAKFKIHNLTEEEKVFDASAKKLEYSLDINLGTISRVSLSMLENDLQYMPITVPANGSADAVLVFEIDDVPIDTAHLIIESESDDTVFIKMK